MLRLVHPLVFIGPLLLVVLFSRTECSRRDNLSIHVTLRDTNCSLPCQRVDNDTCVGDCPPRSYCDDYFQSCVECQEHCVHCMSSDFCLECDDDLEPVVGRGCAKPCKLGYYLSPYATQCLACAQHCSNCSGLNQCHNCSDNYILHDEMARQVCILNCTNRLFYNQTADQCQACPEHCKNCVPSLGCVECEDHYVISNYLCILATPTVTVIVTTPTTNMQPTATHTSSAAATPTVTKSVQTAATPTTAMQSTATLKSNSTATPTATVQPKESKKNVIYIVGGVGGGAVAIVTLIIVLIIVACYRKKSKVDFRPLLQFGEDDSDEEEEEEYTNINNS